MVEAGKADELLSELENRIKSANTEEEIQAARDEFPRGGIFSLLNNSCDYFDRGMFLLFPCTFSNSYYF